jgi:hypothetical protein
MEHFTYFHCYAEDLWRGYERNGLLRRHFGIRFPQAVNLPEGKKFNALAARGGALHRIVFENRDRCAFCVDRLQGGAFIQDYAYDQDLVAEYERLLGDRFLGFQMHEWLSNYKSDLTKLAEVPDEAWTKENIEAAIFRRFPYPYLFLESMTAEEMAVAGRPQTSRAFYRNMTDIYRKRAKACPLLPCDSAFAMYPFEAENGARAIMPEVGAQTPDMRVQMCFARGVCRAYGITLGAYYEPWGGKPFSCCTYLPDGRNEWEITGDTFPFSPGGPNGGSSRSLQWRVHLYAYLSGARFISEEWGGYNTFADLETFELSEYGLVKKRFLDFVERYPDLGEKVAPVAAVLPNDLPCYTIGGKSPDDPSLFGYELAGGARERYVALRRGAASVFSNALPRLGDEQRTLIHSDVPDAVDMLNEGDGHALDAYRYLVDLTGDPAFAKLHPNCIAPERVAEVLRGLLPCVVEGGLHYLLNRRGEDGYYLTVFNHGGVRRSQEKGETVLPEADRTAVITLKEGRALKALEGSRDVTFENGRYYVTLHGGDWFFAAI